MENHQIQSQTIWKSLQSSKYVYQYQQPLSQSDSTAIFIARFSDNPTLPCRALKFYKQQSSSIKFLLRFQGKYLQNVVELFEVKIGNPSYLIMELCQQNLRTVLKQAKQNILTDQIISYGTDIIQGIISLKKERIMHCDIKPENLVFSQKGQLKVCDLDFSISQTEAANKKIRVGTLQYMAPEILKQGKCSYKSDVWSLGIVLYEMTFGTHPFPEILSKHEPSQKTFNQCYQILRNSIVSVRKQIIQLKEKLNEQNRQIILQTLLQCLSFESDRRADIEDINLLNNFLNQPIRKNSWFSETTDNSQPDLSISSNTKLVAVISNLKFLLCSLPSASHQFKKNKQLLAIIDKVIVLSEDQGKMRMITLELKKQLQNQLLKSWKRMERNVQRFTTLEQKIMFGNDKLLVELKRIYNILRGLQEEEFQGFNIKKPRSAEFFH